MTSTQGPQRSRGWRIATCLLAGGQLFFAPSGAGAQARQSGGTVAGQVTDSRTRLAVAGTLIELQGTRLGATTGADGRYRIPGVPAGSQIVVARRIGYTSERQTVTAGDGQSATADFHLEAAAYSLEQIVVTGTAEWR